MYAISLIVQSLKFHKLYNCIVSVNFTNYFSWSRTFCKLRVLRNTTFVRFEISVLQCGCEHFPYFYDQPHEGYCHQPKYILTYSMEQSPS